MKTYLLLFIVLLGPCVYANPVLAQMCIQNATKQCVSNIAYWYDSCGALQSIYQNCNTTHQTCQNGTCIDNATTKVLTPATTPSPNQTTNSSTVGTIAPQEYGGLAVVLLGKKQSDTVGWTTSMNVNPDESVAFLVTVKNNSTAQIEDIVMNLQSNVALQHISALTIDGKTSTEDITTGIAIGALAPNISKVITFTANAPSDPNQTVQIQASAASGTIPNTSTLSLVTGAAVVVATSKETLPPATVTANAAAGNDVIFDFLKKWYIWIMIVIILSIVFLVIFRRLSNRV